MPRRRAGSRSGGRESAPAEEEVSDLRPPKDFPSPLTRLKSANGIAHQIELVALFVAQHERGQRSGVSVPFTTPMHPQTDEPSWVGLVVPTPQERSRPGNPSPRSQVDLKRRQLTRALDRLASVPLMELSGAGHSRGKYERFRLLQESGPRPLSGPQGYRIPAAGTDGLIELPVEFFLNGWVYALTFNEIVLYLMLRDVGPGAGAFEVPHEDRLKVYGVSRDAYSSWWLLEHAGLIRVHVDEDRLSNGTVLGYDPKGPSAPHIFELTDQGLLEDGPRRVADALRAHVAGEPVGISKVNPTPGASLLTF